MIREKLLTFAYSLHNFSCVQKIIQSHADAKASIATDIRKTRSKDNTTAHSEKFTKQLSLPLLIKDLAQEQQTKLNKPKDSTLTDKIEYVKIKAWITSVRKRIRINQLIRKHGNST